MENLDQQQAETLSAIADANTPEAVEAIRVSALGKQGWVSALLKSLGGMTPDQRQSEGPKIHAAREAVTAALAVLDEPVPVTLPSSAICPPDSA